MTRRMNLVDKISVLTFQSQEVLDIILNGEDYNVDYSKCREKHDYTLEKETYGFNNVIWCFSAMGFDTLEPNNFSKEDFINASLFERFRSEMSINFREELNNLVLLELEYNKEELKPGLTHNHCSGVMVVDSLSLDNLKAVYRLEYNDEDDKQWFYPKVYVDRLLSKDTIFTEEFLCGNK